MMTTLTDRYVWAVTRLLPEGQRPEIDRELRSSIADMIEARGGGDGDEAAVLLELGDPSRLAAGYAERPRYLIGPEDFPEYLRMLKLVAVLAIPGIAFLALLGAAIDEDAGGELVGTLLSSVVTAAVHVGFWVTLFYAVRARVGHEPWTLESLPDLPQNERVARSDTIFELAVVAVSIGAIFWDRRGHLSDGDGDGVPFLHPSLWDGWIFAVIGLLMAGGVVALLVRREGRWTPPLVAANLGINAVLLAVVGWLAFDDRVVNPRFLEVLAEEAEWTVVPETNPWIVVLLVGAVLVWDSAETVVRSRRHAVQDAGRAAGTPGTDPLIRAER